MDDSLAFQCAGLSAPEPMRYAPKLRRAPLAGTCIEIEIAILAVWA
jgi:hypothetical protein